MLGASRVVVTEGLYVVVELRLHDEFGFVERDDADGELSTAAYYL